MEDILNLLSFLLRMLSVIETNKEIQKEEILVNWELSKHYPRKKKKKVRKCLTIDWHFACFDILDCL